jgi:hypothetical protein
MRVVEETIASSGKKRILFACGIEDIKILAGMVMKAKMYTPLISKVEEEISLHNRLNSMGREFSKYLNQKETKPKHPKTHRCPFCEKSSRGERALQMHVDKIHSKQL